MSQSEKKQCEGSKHYYDVIDGRIAERCRCGGHKRKLMK